MAVTGAGDLPLPDRQSRPQGQGASHVRQTSLSRPLIAQSG